MLELGIAAVLAATLVAATLVTAILSVTTTDRPSYY
jgi:hypothetical protein